jgi:hypothetical protein
MVLPCHVLVRRLDELLLSRHFDGQDLEGVPHLFQELSYVELVNHTKFGLIISIFLFCVAYNYTLLTGRRIYDQGRGGEFTLGLLRITAYLIELVPQLLYRGERLPLVQRIPLDL